MRFVIGIMFCIFGGLVYSSEVLGPEFGSNETDQLDLSNPIVLNSEYRKSQIDQLEVGSPIVLNSEDLKSLLRLKRIIGEIRSEYSILTPGGKKYPLIASIDRDKISIRLYYAGLTDNARAFLLQSINSLNEKGLTEQSVQIYDMAIPNFNPGNDYYFRDISEVGHRTVANALRVTLVGGECKIGTRIAVVKPVEYFILRILLIGSVLSREIFKHAQLRQNYESMVTAFDTLLNKLFGGEIKN